LSGYAEMQLILCKDTANREQKRQTRLSGYAEMQLILCKDTATNAMNNHEPGFSYFSQHKTPLPKQKNSENEYRFGILF